MIKIVKVIHQNKTMYFLTKFNSVYGSTDSVEDLINNTPHPYLGNIAEFQLEMKVNGAKFEILKTFNSDVQFKLALRNYPELANEQDILLPRGTNMSIFRILKEPSANIFYISLEMFYNEHSEIELSVYFTNISDILDVIERDEFHDHITWIDEDVIISIHKNTEVLYEFEDIEELKRDNPELFI